MSEIQIKNSELETDIAESEDRQMATLADLKATVGKIEETVGKLAVQIETIETKVDNLIKAVSSLVINDINAQRKRG